MTKQFSMELAGRTLMVEVGRVAAQANGAAFMHYGDTVVLSTATASEKPRDGIDFFPLSVEYEEKLYAVGKIPGGYLKREGKPSENAILTDRVIDRPMRPLFPKDYRNDVALNNLVMSVDPDCSPELTAMLGSAIATAISDIPFDGPTASTMVGLIDGEFVINPTSAQKEVSDLALTVASTREKVVMLPFVRNKADLIILREALREYGCEDIRIFAKIENMTGVEHLEELIPYCDYIVIARGDLGNAMPLSQLPRIQAHIARVCRKHNKDFMIVTQMLDSMIKNPYPTRAEVNDIYHAVTQGASTLMLTGETAHGKYPVEAMKMLVDTAEESIL